MIKFKVDIGLHIIKEYDEVSNCEVDSYDADFYAGEILDANVYSEEDEYADIQFADGSVCLGVYKGWFDVINN